MSVNGGQQQPSTVTLIDYRSDLIPFRLPGSLRVDRTVLRRLPRPALIGTRCAQIQLLAPLDCRRLVLVSRRPTPMSNSPNRRRSEVDDEDPVAGSEPGGVVGIVGGAVGVVAVVGGVVGGVVGEVVGGA